jgi:hypothetical protein
MAAAVPVISVIATVASTAYSAYSSYQAGAEEKKERRRAAEEISRRRELEAQAAERKHRGILATQRALYGAAGVTMEGSPLLVQIESLRESEEELARIRSFGEYEATQQRRLGQMAQRSGYVEAGGEAIRGAGQIPRIYYDWWG